MEERREIHPEQCHLILCRTVFAEFREQIPHGMSWEVVPFSFHERPEMARGEIRRRIDAAPKDRGYVILGYGLCSNSLVGLSSANHCLVFPKVHDCIALFLGSQANHRLVMEEEAGTLFLTKGFIESEEGEVHIMDFPAYRDRYGEQAAKDYMKMLLKEYKRTVLLDTGSYPLSKYKQIGEDFAGEMGLTFQVRRATDALFSGLVSGDWNKDIVRVCKGDEISITHFL